MKMNIRQIAAAMVCGLMIAGETSIAACAAEPWNGNAEDCNISSDGRNANAQIRSEDAQIQNGNTESWDENVEITAHRGDSSEAPENTIPAFEAAIESGADWIELDVGVTKDGILVVLNDDDFKRVACDYRKIGDLTFE